MIVNELPRNVKRVEWRQFWRVFRRYHRPVTTDESAIGMRQTLVNNVRGEQEGGYVCIVTTGMDCDCSQFCWTSIVPAVPRAVERTMQETFEGAEGPMHCQIVRPSEAPEPWSRDLALEAFEDGHPHVVRPH